MSFAQSLLGYTPAMLRKSPSMGEFIEFYVFNPLTFKMDRQRIKLNRLRKQFDTRSLYRQHVVGMLGTLNAKLATGWSPLGTTQDVKEFTPIREALSACMRDKGRDLREASMVSYCSIAKLLTDWLASQDLDTMPVHLFNMRIARRYMDYLLTRPKFSNNTFNTYLKKYRAVWSWLVEHNYAKENAFTKIKVRMKQEKVRGLIPSSYRMRVLDYIRSGKDANFELVLHLIFSSLIRPSEIERLQVGDIDLENACVHIAASKSKTHFERYAPLSDACIRFMSPLLVGCPSHWYLIGTRLVPSKNPCYHGKFKKMWIKIREKCKLPADMQLYSLKDSGITELLESGLDALTVMRAADHHDLTTTTKYACHCDKSMISKVRNAGVQL